jgi:integrase/recombinase XerD
MGLRLEEALSHQVGDIDAERKRIHIRRGKGHKDRLIPLPDLTLLALRELWRKHRHPKLLFPNGTGSLKTIQQATTHMDRGGAQKAMKVVVNECGIKKKSLSTPFVIMRSFRLCRVSISNLALIASFFSPLPKQSILDYSA